ncbi:calcium-transporting ATPase [Phlyctochytrium arcticum]|nr:calcium-transporting ATPase [Phlyctochytrium arcticum]
MDWIHNHNPFNKVQRFNTRQRDLRGPEAREIVERPFHTFSDDQILKLFKVDSEHGLDTEQVDLRLTEHGPNELVGNDGVSPWEVLLRQLLNALTLVLIIAAAIALAIKDWLEAGVIIFVIFFNTIVGFLQEYRAEKTMESLRRTASPTARVMRNNGHIDVIAAKDLVPGDIIMIEQGDSVGGDARLIETFNLEVDEAMLTGESLPVEKNTERIQNPDQDLGDRINMVYLGTNVVKGRGVGVIVTTGMRTQMGRIAKSLMNADEKMQTTPLQKRLNKLALALFGFAVILAIIVFAVYDFKFSPAASIYAISVAIAMIPEGLVAVVTLTMALGVRRMAKQKAIVRKLSALEALGSTTDICSDKTGTLTQGKMVLTKIYIPGEKYYDVSGSGLNPKGEILSATTQQTITQDSMSPAMERLLQACALCNTSSIRKDEDPHGAELWVGSGDPTEVALQVLAHKAQMGKPQLLQSRKNPEGVWNVIQEFPFDSSLKRMSVIYTHIPTNETFIFAKGGLESLVPRCSAVWDGQQEVPINGVEYMETLQDRVSEMAGHGLRVLSIGYRRLPTKFDPKTVDREFVEEDIVLLALVGINDPPRPETKAAVAKCHQAGITVRMLTGDHPKTAAAIAEQVGILDSLQPTAGNNLGNSATTINMDAVGSAGGKLVWTGQEFDALTDDQVDKLPELPRVVARCTPETKVKMIDALERRKRIAAMTGDGVNDSPSLKKAPIGIAMGMSGSDVAKQASSIVLTDDNFSTIVSAVAQGRRIFANIQKFVLHLML